MYEGTTLVWKTIERGIKKGQVKERKEHAPNNAELVEELAVELTKLLGNESFNSREDIEKWIDNNQIIFTIVHNAEKKTFIDRAFVVKTKYQGREVDMWLLLRGVGGMKVELADVKLLKKPIPKKRNAEAPHSYK